MPSSRRLLHFCVGISKFQFFNHPGRCKLDPELGKKFRSGLGKMIKILRLRISCVALLNMWAVMLQGFIAKMRKTGRRLVVFYGSQTGTAEEFAGRLFVVFSQKCLPIKKVQNFICNVGTGTFCKGLCCFLPVPY